MGTLKRWRQLARDRNVPAASKLLLLLSVFVICTCFGCETGARKRPIGYVRLGLAAELAQHPETFFSEARILVRYDDGGFSAMSTACTQDLSALTRIGEGSAKRWVSSYSNSAYDEYGRVLAGPTRADLPYYKLQIAAGSYGGVPDTLFVELGSETTPAWRLSFNPAR